MIGEPWCTFEDVISVGKGLGEKADCRPLHSSLFLIRILVSGLLLTLNKVNFLHRGISAQYIRTKQRKAIRKMVIRGHSALQGCQAGEKSV